jgi:parallel beta-helix repeat protein
MPSVTLVSPRGDTTRDVTTVPALDAYVRNRGWAPQTGDYAAAYQTLTGQTYTPGASGGSAAASIPEPSGDATGAADSTAIQAALTGGAGGVVAFPHGRNYTVNTTLRVPSNTTVQFNRSMVTLAPGCNVSVFSNAGYWTTGDTGIRMVGPGGADANRAQQTAEVCPFDFNQLTLSTFDGIEGRGGRRNLTYPNGTNGEGIVLRNSTYCDIVNGNFHDNDYDGIKLRTSNYCRIAGNTCRDNGRSGVQISMNSQTDPTHFTAAPFSVGEGVEAAGANYNIISGNKLFHSTGTPGASCPTTSGVYIHTGVGNIVSSNSVYGFRQGIGLFGGASRNQIVGNELTLRYTDRGALHVETAGAGTCSYNQFADNIITWLSGANPVGPLVGEGLFNRYFGNRFILGAATGSVGATVGPNCTNTLLAFDSGYGTALVANSGGNTSILQAQAGVLTSLNGLGTGQSAAATTLGALSRRIPMFNESGTLLGYVPVYTTIT